VTGSIADNATVVAGGNVEVLARALSQQTETGTPPTDLFAPGAVNVGDDAGDTVTPFEDTITFTPHGLGDDSLVPYHPDPDGEGTLPATTPIGTSGGPLAPPPTGPGAQPATYADREYRVIVVDNDRIRLGTTFSGGPADTGSLFSPGVGV